MPTIMSMSQGGTSVQSNADDRVSVVNQGTSLIFAVTFMIAVTVDQLASEASARSTLLFTLLVGIPVAQAIAYGAFGWFLDNNASLAKHRQIIETSALFSSLPYVGWQV